MGKDQLMLVVKSGLGVEDNTAHKIPAAEVQPERKESPKHRKKGKGWLSLEINVKTEVMAQARCRLEEGIYSERSSNPSRPTLPPKAWLHLSGDGALGKQPSPTQRM